MKKSSMRAWLTGVMVLCTFLLSGAQASVKKSAQHKKIQNLNAKSALEKSYGFALTVVKNKKLPPPLAAYYLAHASQAAYEVANDTNSKSARDAYMAAFVLTFTLFVPEVENEALEFLDQNVSDNLDNETFDQAIEYANRQYASVEIALDSAKRAEYRHIGSWEKTPPAFAEPLLPGFGLLNLNEDFNRADLTSDLQPLDLESVAFKAQLSEVMQMGEKTSTIRTEEQSLIANFWAAGAGTVTPPGMWTEFALAALRGSEYNFKERIEVMRTVSQALADAAIVCWGLKYGYDLLRPITAIRQLHNESWEPLLDTPPFPSYTSGHSSFSMTAATILDYLFAPAQVTLKSEGFAPRNFSSYKDAAVEAGMSRIYGGIHYAMDNIDGLKLGERIACEYLERRWGVECHLHVLK